MVIVTVLEKFILKIERLKLNKITYGIIPNSDVFIMRNRQLENIHKLKQRL